MNIFDFSIADTIKSFFMAIGYGLYFGFFIGLFRFLLLTFFERESA